MVVRQYHHKQIRFLLLLEIIFVYFLISSLFLIPVHSGFTVIIILYVLSQTCILYTFAFELRAYIVCNNGICIKWFGVYNYLINWAEVKYIGYEMVEKRGTYLVIKQYHNKQVKGLIIAEILILFIFSCALLYIHSHKEDYTTNDSIAIIVVGLIIQTFLVYCLGFELKAYKVCDNGIYVKWFGLLCYLLEWGEIKYIRIEIVKQKSIENNSILVSKIPIKTNDYPRGINSYFSAVDNDWLALRPSKVIAIYIDEMNPDQYEEFWSYVPEHLKGNYIPQK